MRLRDCPTCTDAVIGFTETLIAGGSGGALLPLLEHPHVPETVRINRHTAGKLRCDHKVGDFTRPPEKGMNFGLFMNGTRY